MRRKVADGHCRKCWIHQSEAMYGKAGDTEWGGSSVSLIMSRLAGSRFQTTESDSASLWQVRSDAFSVEKRCDTLRSKRIIPLTPCISPPSVGRWFAGMRLSSLSAPPLCQLPCWGYGALSGTNNPPLARRHVDGDTGGGLCRG